MHSERNAPGRRGLDRRAARIGLAALVALAAASAPGAARGDDFPTEITGKAALAHPAGKAVVEAAKLLRAGKLAEVKQSSVKEVREEWAALSAAERKEESERARERAPDPATFEADIARVGILLLYGETATLRVPTADGADVTAMAFVSLEAGKWKVTGGPMAFEPAPAETAPPVQGAAILDARDRKARGRVRQAARGGEDRSRHRAPVGSGAGEAGRRAGRRAPGERRVPTSHHSAGDGLRRPDPQRWRSPVLRREGGPERRHERQDRQRRRQHELHLDHHRSAVRARERRLADRRLRPSWVPEPRC